MQHGLGQYKYVIYSGSSYILYVSLNIDISIFFKEPVFTNTSLSQRCHLQRVPKRITVAKTNLGNH